MPGWVPSISPELAFLPCVEGLLAEREGDASLCTMIPAAGSRHSLAGCKVVHSCLQGQVSPALCIRTPDRWAC